MAGLPEKEQAAETREAGFRLPRLFFLQTNPPLSPSEKSRTLIFLAPPGERIEVRGNDPRTFSTLTLTPFDGLTALSLSKGSPLKGEGNYVRGLHRAAKGVFMGIAIEPRRR